MVKIVLCGSMVFINNMMEIKVNLEKMGFSVDIPEIDESQYKQNELFAKHSPNVKQEFINGHIAKIRNADAVLIVNENHKSIENYIGANSFLEIGFAYLLGKRIFLWNDIPEQGNAEEIAGMKPMVLKQDLNRLKNYFAEQTIVLDTPDNHKIYGTLNKGDEPTEDLMILVPGLTAIQNEHKFFNAARFFPEKGYDVFRFDLYSAWPQGRAILDCTVQTHINDLDLVFKHFEKQYRNIHLIGHSLGTTVILKYDHSRAKSLILWDPSLEIREGAEEWATWNQSLNAYVLEWGVQKLISKQMFEDMSLANKEIVRDFKRPAKIICAGNGILTARWEKIKHEIPIPYDFTVVEGADHNFNQRDTEIQLFDKTLEWLNGESYS